MAAPRDLTGDVAGMRALAHPLRLELLDLLRAGPMTASEAASALGELPGNMSWHLRVLAKHGFVEEEPGAAGRRRPWRLVSRGTRWDDESGTAEERQVGDELTNLVMRRAVSKMYAWIDGRGEASPEAQRAAQLATGAYWLSADEAATFGSELEHLLERYRAVSDARTPPSGAVEFDLLLALHPHVARGAGTS